jgi:hypothetical protein
MVIKMNESSDWTKDLDDDQKAYVIDLIITTVKEIREQIALDIEATVPVWQRLGFMKSRRTKAAFKVCSAIARGQNERVYHGNE